MIKLIASDLDGTLIPEGTQEIEPGFFEVLSELLDQGYQFYVATGRQYANVRRLFSDCLLYTSCIFIFPVDF